MPVRCAFLSCRSTRSTEILTMSFFKFPLNEPMLCAQWIDVVNRKNWIPTASSRICELHFKSSDFYNTPGTRLSRLKPDVVPSQNIPDANSATTNTYSNACNMDIILPSVNPDVAFDNRAAEASRQVLNVRKRCEVIGCSNATNKGMDKKHLFNFPQTEAVAVRWIKATGRTNWIPKKSSAICEIHFTTEDFSNTKVRKRLKPDAVPKKNLFASSIIERPDKHVWIKSIIDIDHIQNTEEIDISREETEMAKTMRKETKKASTRREHMEDAGQETRKALVALKEAELKIRKLEEENAKLKELIRSLQEKHDIDLKIQASALNEITKKSREEFKKKLAIKNKELKMLRLQLKRKVNKINNLLTAAKA